MKHGWDYKKLGELVQVLNGYAFKSSLYENQGIRVLRITNVQKGNIVDDDPKYYPLSLTDEIRNYLLKENDLLMSLTGNVGRVGLLTKEMLPAALNQRVACLRILSNGLNLGFLFHYLNSDKFEQDAVLSAKGIAQKNMSTEWLKDYKLPLPPISVQQTIVSELDKINELIRLKKEQLGDYEKLAQSLFYEMFGDPVENEKGWEVKKLGEEYKVSSSKRIMQDEWTTEGVPFLKVSDVVSKINGQNSKPSTFISETTYSKLVDSNAVPVQNDILITSRGTLGLCYIVKNEDRFYFQDGMITWLAECKGNITPLFLTYLFKNHHFLQQITSKANKSTVAYISISQISKRKIPLPPLSLQNLFAQRIELIEQQKAEIKSTIADLETLLASRMQYWFFGF